MSQFLGLTPEEMTIWAVVMASVLVVVLLLARGQRRIVIEDRDRLD